ncbi:hypothetical protein ACQY0O_000694 [Thecaphora frezii]
MPLHPASSSDYKKETPPATPTLPLSASALPSGPATPPHRPRSDLVDGDDENGGLADGNAGSYSPSSLLGSGPMRSRANTASMVGSAPMSDRDEVLDIGLFRLDAIEEQQQQRPPFYHVQNVAGSPIRKRTNTSSSTGRIPSNYAAFDTDFDYKAYTSKLGKDRVEDGADAALYGSAGGSGSKAAGDDSVHPPSFAESQFATIIRRQRKRRVFSPAHVVGGAPDVEANRRRNDADNREGSNGEGEGEGDGYGGCGADTGAAESSSGPVRLGDRKGLQLKVGGASAFPADREEPMMAADQAWEFAGWGSISLLELTAQDMAAAAVGSDGAPRPLLGQWRAAAIAGNAVTGSVFYALPAVIVTASVVSPLSIFVACLLLWPFRPVMCELASALSASNAGNYSYFSNVSTKTVSLLAAAITMLDAIATAAVSAGTASAYIAGETVRSDGTAPVIDARLISILLLVGLALLCLSGLRDSSSLALTMFLIHMASMVALILAGAVAWARQGNALLAANWHLGIGSLTAAGTGKGIARAIFDGICVAFVGLTGFECSPSYVNSVKPGEFAKALRNLHVIVIVMEAVLMLLVLANLPLDVALGGANVLALLGQVSAKGDWLKICIVVDACLVLCGGIMTGAIAFSGLMEALCDDGVVPRMFGRTLRKTGAPYVSLGLFLGLSIVMSATCGFNLTTLSSVCKWSGPGILAWLLVLSCWLAGFVSGVRLEGWSADPLPSLGHRRCWWRFAVSVSFLCIMTLFGVALLALKCVRPTLPRQPVASVLVVVVSILVGIVSMAGNFALSPVMAWQTLVYFGVLAVVLVVLAKRVGLAKGALWIVNQTHLPQTSLVRKRIIRWIRAQRRRPVIYFTATDDISVLVNALYYIKNNEETQTCKLVHCYREIEEIPDQLDETFQLVDEVFPTITVDLVLVEAPFQPNVVRAVAKKLGVPPSRAFISCPSSKGECIGTKFKLEEYGGVRIISA